MEAVFIKRRALSAGEVGLFAVDDEGRELLAKIKDEKQVKADVVQSRHIKHHRLYWAMVKLLKEQAPIFETADMEAIHVAIKLATGLVKTFVDAETGQTIMVPLSTSFASMDEARFSAFFDAAVATICNRWLVGSTVDEVRAEIERMADPIGYGRAA